MQIQISWLLQKPTHLGLHCLQRQGISGFSRTKVKKGRGTAGEGNRGGPPLYIGQAGVLLYSFRLSVCLFVCMYVHSFVGLSVIFMELGFVYVEVLRPSQPNGVMSSAVSLPNHTFTGQA